MAQRKKTPKMLLIEARDEQRRSIEKIMLDAYTEGGTQTAAAKIMGISQGLFSWWLTRLNIQLPEVA